MQYYVDFAMWFCILLCIMQTTCSAAHSTLKLIFPFLETVVVCSAGSAQVTPCLYPSSSLTNLCEYVAVVLPIFEMEKSISVFLHLRR